MPENDSFADFLRRIRAGDAEAAAELVRRYETTIRVAVRTRLTDISLKRQFDSMDICQSVLASFLVRVSAGQYDLEAPEQLAKLLARMARNKLVSQARKQRSEGRDARREVPTGLDGIDPASPEPSPSEQIADRDLLRAVRERLTDEERRLADLRGEGLSWPEIAVRLGGTASGRRKQLGRALDHISEVLGLDLVDGGEDSDA